MKVESRMILTLLIRLAFVVFAGWLLVVPSTLPGSPDFVRMGLAATLLVIAILVGEVAKLQTQFEMLMRALRAATGKAGGAAAQGTEREAVGILIRALESREPATREKAHRNLVRLTGQDLPPEREAWEAWWKEHKKTWGREG